MCTCANRRSYLRTSLLATIDHMIYIAICWHDCDPSRTKQKRVRRGRRVTSLGRHRHRRRQERGGGGDGGRNVGGKEGMSTLAARAWTRRLEGGRRRPGKNPRGRISEPVGSLVISSLAPSRTHCSWFHFAVPRNFSHLHFVPST